MTVIRPNSISGVTSITALTNSIEFYKSDGSLSGANIDGISINTSGIITANTFYGNGANLTGIDATTIKDSGGNTRVAGTLTGAVVTGIFTATASMNVKQSGNAYLNLLSTGTGNAGIYMDASNGDIAGSDYCSIYQKNDLDLAITNRKNTANIIFETGGETERVRIDSSGKLIVKTNGMNLENATATSSRGYAITNAAGTTGWTFGNGITASSHQYVIYDNTAGSARFQINGNGAFGLNGGNYGAARQVMVSNGSGSAVSWSSNPFLLDMDSLGDLDYDGVFLRYREVNVSGNGLVYLGLCKSTTNCPAGRIGCPVGYVPGVVYNSQFRVDKVGITPWPDGSGHRYEYFAIISDYVSAGKLGIFYLTNSTN